MRWTIALSCLGALLIGCDPQPVVAPLEPSRFVAEDGTVRGQEGWRLRPLALEPAVTRAEAVEVVTTGPFGDPAGADVEAHYGLFTSQTPRQERSGKLQFEDVPAWVVVVDGAKVCEEGPMPEGPQKEPNCEAKTVFVVVDARTGNWMMSSVQSGCGLGPAVRAVPC